MMRRFPNAILGLGALSLLIALGAGCNAGGPAHKKTATERNGMPEISYGLKDEDFWTGRNRTVEATVDKAEAADFRGILLEGPQVVDISKRNSLHLVGLRRTTFEENFFLRLETRAVLAAVLRQDNAVLAATAWTNKSEEEENFTPPADGFPEGSSLNPFEIDVRDRLPGLSWNPGTVTFTLFLFDQQSNPVPVRFLQPDRVDAGVRPEPKTARSAWPLPDPVAGHSFQKHPSTPAPPESPSLAIQMDKTRIPASGGECMVKGTFRLEALPGEKVGLPPGALAISGEPPATAVVSVTLLILGDQVPGPWVFPLHVPVSGNPDAGPLEGYFKVNLLQLPGAIGLPQTYVVRALHGAAQSGPVKFTLVSE